MAAASGGRTAFSAEEFTTLLIDERPDRVHVQLNRPQVHNAIDQAMIDELHAVCAELESRPRLLIISGAAGVFASGADIAQLKERRRNDALTGINSTLFARHIEREDRQSGIRARHSRRRRRILAAQGAGGGAGDQGDPIAGRVLNAEEALALHLITESTSWPH